MSLMSERVSDVLGDELPNLKIEIENDLNLRMEIDADDNECEKMNIAFEKGAVSSEMEEGELIDDEDKLSHPNYFKLQKDNILSADHSGRSILKYDKEVIEIPQETNTSTVKNPNGAFVTGLNVFSPEEQAKLDKRAQRFGIEAVEGKVLTEKLLKKLYKSMGVKPTDKNIRLESLHMRGTVQMTTKDVFTYFKDYGPAALEWINDNSCNVVWLDEISAARALLGLSVHISGQTSPQPVTSNATITNQDQDPSDIEMEEVNGDDNLSEESDSVPVSDLGIKLPPGRWRKGAPYPLSPNILLRFATTSDKSLPRPGFTKFGSDQSGGYTGLISESRKRRIMSTLPGSIVFDDMGDEIIPKPSLEETDSANPWGILAKTWSQFDKVRQPRHPSPVIERVLPLPSRITPPPSPPIFYSRPQLVARRRRLGRRVSLSDDSSDGEWCSRSKLPRMRMHADDEEKKLEKRIKKSHRNRSLSYSPNRSHDLRQRIGGQRYRSDGHSDVEDSPGPEPVIEEPEDDEIPDLRVAVATDRSPSPEDSKIGIRNSLFQSGNVKSVLKGARGHSENDDNESEEEKEKSSKRHRSRSKEQRRHHRRHKKETSHHRSRRRSRNSDSESDERVDKTVKSMIKRISPEKVRKRSESRERMRGRTSRHEERRKRRGEVSHRKLEPNRKSDKSRHSGDSRSSRDLRAKLSHRHYTYDSNNEFRSKSPLQIEINNEVYYRRGSD